MTTCPKCNTESINSSIYCSNCGTDLNTYILQNQLQVSVRLINENRFKEAEELLFVLYEENPTNANIVNNIGLMYLRNKNRKEARNWFRKALEIDQSHRIARSNLKRTSLWRRYSWTTGLLMFVIGITFVYLSDQSDTSGTGRSSKSKNSFAIYDAKDLVVKNLLSPSTVQWAEIKIVDQRESYYMIFVSLDSQNGFGAMLRQNYLVSIQLKDEDYKNKIYYTTSSLSLQTCSNNPDQSEINMYETLNYWPAQTIKGTSS